MAQKSEAPRLPVDRAQRGSFGPGALLQMIRSAPVWTRAELVRQSSLGRTAVAERIDQLVEAGLVRINPQATSTGGRPAETYSFNADEGRLLVADIGGRHTRLGITDLAGRLIASAEADLDSDQGAAVVMAEVVERLDRLTHEVGLDRARLRGIGVGVPGPVDEGVMQRAYLPGWEGEAIPTYFAAAFPGLPVTVDKDANILVRGEQARDPEGFRNAIVLKVGMGVSCGVIVDGRVLHGAQGAAADIGHLPAPERGVPCRCGMVGCTDAVASGRAIETALRATGRDARTSREIVDLVRANDPEVLALVRQAGRDLGTSLGVLCAVVNPSVIVVGGNLAESPEPLLAGIRETIYRDFPPALTRGITIVPSAIGAEAGLAGAAQLAVDELLAPDNVDAMISARS